MGGIIAHGKIVKKGLEQRNKGLQAKAAGIVSSLRQAKAKNVKLAKTEAKLMALQAKFNNSSAKRKAAAAAAAAKKALEAKRAAAVSKNLKQVKNGLLSAKL